MNRYTHVSQQLHIVTYRFRKQLVFCLDNAVVQFIFISRGNTNYHMKNDNMSDNDSNDRIMTHL